MKVLAVLLLCAFAAVQGRSAVGVAKSTKGLAALGEHPWLVHLRIAVSTSGFLNTCGGSLIASNWALTTASCVADVRFIWVRYGAVNVVNPSLVTETSTTRSNSDANVALVALNRHVHSTDTIAPVALSVGGTEEALPESTSFCAFGDIDGPGEVLSCWDVTLTQVDGVITASSDDGAPTVFDIGAPLVSDGVQFGVLVNADNGSFRPVAEVISWIEGETGLSFSPDAKNHSEAAAESNDDSLLVKFVN